VELEALTWASCPPPATPASPCRRRPRHRHLDLGHDGAAVAVGQTGSTLGVPIVDPLRSASAPYDQSQTPYLIGTIYPGKDQARITRPTVQTDHSEGYDTVQNFHCLLYLYAHCMLNQLAILPISGLSAGRTSEVWCMCTICVNRSAGKAIAARHQCLHYTMPNHLRSYRGYNRCGSCNG
jgi:hypothetical protein